MSRKEKLDPVNRITVRALINSKEITIKEFCETHQLNYDSFRRWLSGDNTLTNINKKIYQILIDNNIHPFTDPLPTISPEIKLQLAGATS